MLIIYQLYDIIILANLHSSISSNPRIMNNDGKAVGENRLFFFCTFVNLVIISCVFADIMI